jgi:acetyl-CoA carboxylase carboxyltransferase component
VLSSQPVRLAPQERLERLCDPDSFRQFDPLSEGVGVQAGGGLVGGRPVVCYAQDSRIAGGSVGVREADVVVRAMRRSRDERIPLVAFLESAGARLQEGSAALGGFGRIFYENVALSGRVPQISVICGTSAGGGCYSPALTDFVMMVDRASMFITGPRVVKQAVGEDVTASDLGGTRVHERNGVCDFVAPDDYGAINLIRELIAYLPRSAADPAPRDASEPPNGEDPSAWLPERTRGYYDVRDVIASIVDGGRFLEVSRRWARNMVVAFARLEGQSVGIVANQARHLGGVIDVEASQKGARFVNTCAAFGVPLLALVDTPGFMPGVRQEAAGVIRHGASLVRAFAAAPPPRATVVLRKAFGGAFITMNSKDLGADATFAWPQAEIGIMSPSSAVNIIHRRELLETAFPEQEAERLAERYARVHVSPQNALKLGVIDAVIDPRDTRSHVAAALLNGAGREIR